MKFSIITSWHECWRSINGLLWCILEQTHKDLEWIVVSDGPVGGPNPGAYLSKVKAVIRQVGGQYIEAERKPGCWGNHARRIGLEAATGDYAVFVNHDNAIFNTYLQSHMENFANGPCVSVIDIAYFTCEQYHGIYPRMPIRVSNIDLLNFAMPTEIAREAKAFCEDESGIYAADWNLFFRASKIIPTVINERLRGIPVGVHI